MTAKIDAHSHFISWDITLAPVSQREPQVLVATLMDTLTLDKLQTCAENTNRAIKLTLAIALTSKDMVIVKFNT
jgi:hypothetical protein